MTSVICPPDLSGRPFRATVEETISAPPDEVYRGWTEKFDRWFAEPGAILMEPAVNSVYFFQSYHDGRDHPHYGRFLRVDPPHLLEFTWMNQAGTGGVETVVTIELSGTDDRTNLRLTHAGFLDEKTATEHEQAWRELIEQRLVPLVTSSR